MASTKHAYHAFFLLFALSLMINFSNATATDCAGSGAISVYWGQKSDDNTEGSLKEACDTGNYNIVILESLIVYDDGTTPDLNLANHCGSVSNPCSILESQIKHCQHLGIKVLISIGQDVRTTKNHNNHDHINKPSLSYEDVDVTESLANYLFENYLSGNASGPLGAVYLDGIDIGDVADSEHLHWDELVKLMKGFTTQTNLYLSASPQCVYPDAVLGPTIQTGLIDYVWVEFFYNNPSCIYVDGSAENLLGAWDKWTSNVPGSLIFLGLAADPNLDGYIPPDALKSEILPSAKNASNYGGVMVWDRYADRVNGYSGEIKESVSKSCRCVCDEPAAYTSFNTLRLSSY